MCAANLAFRLKSTSGAITVTGDSPFAGTAIPLATDNSGITSHIDAIAVSYGAVMQGIGGDGRRLQSALDILASAQISGFQTPILDPQQGSQTGRVPSRNLSRLETSAPLDRRSK